MKTAFGGLMALVLLGLYVYAVIIGILTAYDVHELSEFTDGMAGTMATVGGLVSALVVAELSITKPGEQPVARTLNDDTGSHSSQNIMIRNVTAIYILVWIFVGLAAFVVGVMQKPSIVQPLTDVGQAWLGIAVASVYAYFGIDPKNP